ncbi:MAG: hypothetical protein FWC40_03005 [Proteobacteria bacterium]|nr:hypothetical protein [Pseudomonadota bacterium]
MVRPLTVFFLSALFGTMAGVLGLVLGTAFGEIIFHGAAIPSQFSVVIATVAQIAGAGFGAVAGGAMTDSKASRKSAFIGITVGVLLGCLAAYLCFLGSNETAAIWVSLVLPAVSTLLVTEMSHRRRLALTGGSENEQA